MLLIWYQSFSKKELSTKKKKQMNKDGDIDVDFLQIKSSAYHLSHIPVWNFSYNKTLG